MVFVEKKVYDIGAKSDFILLESMGLIFFITLVFRNNIEQKRILLHIYVYKNKLHLYSPKIIR